MPAIRTTLVAPPADYITRLYGFRSRKSFRSQPPLGIGYIAATLRREGLAVTLLDAAAHGWDIDTTVQRILATRPDVVGVSSITFEAESAFALIRALKKRSGALVVLGGAHANSCYPDIPGQCPQVDVIAAGDGEPIMLDICLALQEGRGFDAIPGIRYRRADGTFSTFTERPVVKDLDSLPPPAYDLYPHHLYRPLPHRHRRSPSTCMITSRGCSYGKCTYCELSGLLKKTFRRHSPGRVADEMRSLLQTTGAREIYFQDDIFVSDPGWVESFCDLLIQARTGAIWSCESRFQGLSGALLEKMARAGCWRIYLGFESGNQELLDGIRKGFTLEEARDAARRVREAGIEVVGFFMLGLPGETPEMGRKTVEFSLELGLDHAIYSLTVPHPNTELYKICEKAGTIRHDTNYHYKKASFVPNGYESAGQLEALRSHAFRRFYFRPGYWLKCVRQLRSLDDLRYYAKGFFSLFSYLD
jgi:anaerobic magnesium-protoporphyrin IX monomethyl ester cyclase